VNDAGIKLLFSQCESDRFGVRVFRCHVDTVDAAAIAAAIERERADVLILRVPAQHIGTVNNLRSQAPAPIVADTLVYYDLELPGNTTVIRDTTVTLRPAESGDAERLAQMAREIFRDYVSHYHANPLFAHGKIVDGYAEWAARHAHSDAASGAWFVECAGAVVGFSCYQIDAVQGVGTGVLNGILPCARGRGAYRGMLRAMQADFARRNLRRFDISTQVHNVVVQRVWTSLGFELRHASNTVHINAMCGRAGL
jgi:hypothetical protein